MGGSKSTPAPAPAAPVKTASEIAEEQVQAQLKFAPQAAQSQFDILAGPAGLEATTRLAEETRKNVFPGEQGVREQLVANILAQLQSPTGLSPDQQTAQSEIRGRAQNELVTALRNRANLGGGLFGGRAAGTEERAVSELQQAFSAEDIERNERARLNAIQGALPLLQLLFPNVGLTPPQFQSPVPSANQSLSSSLAGRGQDINQGQFAASLQDAEANRRAALQSSLFEALGKTAGSAVQAGATIATNCWVAAEIFGGWVEPKTIAARYFVNNKAPQWFKKFYLKHGERIAKYISDKPILKLMLRPLFEMFAFVGNKAVLIGGY